MRNKILVFLITIMLLSSTVLGSFNYTRTYFDNEVKVINQYDTGQYGYLSCVPTSVKMVLDYQGNKTESVSTMFYKMNGSYEGVYLLDTINYLNKQPCTISLPQVVKNKETFKDFIDKNIPYLLMIDPLKIKNQSDDILPILSKKIGKDYITYQNSSHTVSVIGYIQLDDRLVLEVLDPLSRQTLYYDADNVIEALIWNGLITMQHIKEE